MSVIALIPIKFNSNRVKGKNYRSMNGKPLYWYVLNTLMKTKSIDRIVVNIDNEWLKDQIKNHFSLIEFYDRPDHLKGDSVSTNSLLIDMIETLKLMNDDNIFLQTHVTNPLVSSDTFEKSIELYKNNLKLGHDCLFSAKRLQTRLYKYTNNSERILEAVNHNPEELIPTQDLDPIYEENSCIYIFNYEILKKYNHRIGVCPYVFEMSDWESQDIDYEDDFKITELMMISNNNDNNKNNNNKNNNKNRIILVTGSSGGIGREICSKFLSKGWTVIGLDMIEDNDNNDVEKFYKMDLNDLDDIVNVCNEIQKDYGKLDLLVNNAALQICKKWNEYNVNDWNDIMNINVRSAFLLSKLLKTCLKNAKGSIVNISSVHSISTSRNIGLYAVSKGSLLTLTRSMSLEYIEDGINVNCISPGAVRTEMLLNGLKRNNVDLQNLEKKCPAGRIGHPKEIADTVMFLYKNKYIVGENIIVDGGASIKLSTE